MSVGHVTRLFEEGGLPTVIIAAAPFRGRLAAMSPPRLLLTPQPMGRVVGPPHDAAYQRAVLEAALDLLEGAASPTILDFPNRF